MDDGDVTARPPAGAWLGAELDLHALDDASALSDALALVGECGLVSLEDLGLGEDPRVPSDGLDEDAGSQSTATPPADEAVSIAKTKKTTSKRQKEELEYLRSAVAQLEQELSNLKKQSDLNAARDATGVLVEPLAHVWEDIATRQSEQRQRAEVENTKLRVLVEEQLRVAKNFERLLKKRSLTEFLGPSSERIRQKRLGVMPEDSASNFENLWSILDDMYTELDDVISKDRFSPSTLPFRDIHVRADIQLRTVVEAVDMRLAPFELHQLSDATWHHMAHHSHPDTQLIHADRIDMGNDRFTRDFMVSLDTGRIKASFSGNIVARRFVDEERVAVLWTSTMKPTDSTSGVEGMRQKGYALLTKVPDVGGQALTLTRTLLLFSPIENDDSSGSKRAVGALTKFVLSSVSMHMEEAKQQVENALLQTTSILSKDKEQPSS